VGARSNKICAMQLQAGQPQQKVIRRGPATAANLMTHDEARRIAANIVKLPKLLKRP
jgi:hypothetical protein